MMLGLRCWLLMLGLRWLDSDESIMLLGLRWFNTRAVVVDIMAFDAICELIDALQSSIMLRVNND